MDHKHTQKGDHLIEFTYEELLEQNKSLAEELSQCQIDKEFVWNLWKRLQADRPDLSSAVRAVMTREKQKAEVKDKKVLVILEQKDAQLKTLEEVAADMDAQLRQAMERLSALLIENSELQSANANIEAELNKVKEEVTYQQEVLKAKDENQETLIKKHESQGKELTDQNKELAEKVLAYEEEIDKLSKEISNNDSVMKANSVLQEKVKLQEKELELIAREYEEKISLLESREEQLRREVLTVKDQAETLENKDRDLESLRKDLSTSNSTNKELLSHIAEQDALIKHLEVLQDETQQILKHQQQSHFSEVTSYKKTLTDLTDKYKELQIKNEDLSTKMTRLYQECKNGKEVEYKFELLSKQHDSLKVSSDKKTRQLLALERELEEQKELTLSLQRLPDKALKQDTEGSQSVLLTEMEMLLDKKDEELRSLKKAHSQRLQRYKILEENYNLVLKQLETYDKETSTSDQQIPINGMSPKKLKQEDSDSVWNELAFYKQELTIVQAERYNLQEELDQLRVKSATDSVVIQELKIRKAKDKRVISDLEEKFASQMNRVSPSEVDALREELRTCKDKAQNYKKKSEEAQKENKELVAKHRLLYTEIEALSNEVNVLQVRLEEQANKGVKEATRLSSGEHSTKDAELLVSDLSPLPDMDHATGYSNKDETPLKLSIKADYADHISQTSPWLVKTSRVVQMESQSTQTSEFPDSLPPAAIVTGRTGDKKSGKEAKGMRWLVLGQNFKEAKDKRLDKPQAAKSAETTKAKKTKSSLPAKYGILLREHGSMKIRIASLLRQVKILRKEKSRLERANIDERTTMESLKRDLISHQSRMEIMKHTNNRLTEELEARTKKHEDILRHIEQENKETNFGKLNYKEMEARWKLATSECSRLAFQLKTVRGENEMLTGRMKDLQERILHLERTLSQKKNLLDTMKSKLKDTQECLDGEKSQKEELQKKLKALVSRDAQKKEHIENLKNERLKIIQDRQRLHELYAQTQKDLDIKSRLLSDSQALCSQAETAINEIEKAAYIQIQGQADEHKKLVLSTNENLRKLTNRQETLEMTLKKFVDKITNRILQSLDLIHGRRKRHFMEEKKKQEAKITSREARDLACSILNLSTSDLEEFMDDNSDKIPKIEFDLDGLREKLEDELNREVLSNKDLLYNLDVLVEKYVEFRTTECKEHLQMQNM